jgi:hypothetical protein
MQLLSLADVAERLNVSVKTVQRRIDDFVDWPLPRPGRTDMFTEDDFAKLVERMRARAKARTQEIDRPKRLKKSGGLSRVRELTQQWKAEAKVKR